MRLLIYLLALISGCSAAEAARAEVSPASSVAQSAALAAEALIGQVEVVISLPSGIWANEATLVKSSGVPVPIAVNTPLSRHDLSRE